MNNCNIVVFDFETGGLDPKKCVPIQVAAIVINPRTLTPIPGAEFNSMMCPMTEEEFNTIEDGALAVNKKTREQIKAAPVEKLVWQNFTNFVLKHKTKDGWPIPAGQNIINYDLPISERLCEKYGPWDKKQNRQALWNTRDTIDLLHYTFSWFENSNELPNRKMDTLRNYFGLSKEGSHDAFVDVKQTWAIISKFLQLHRTLAPRVQFKGALADAKI
jgi:DNA polymerase III epsilon subunit-like protein